MLVNTISNYYFELSCRLSTYFVLIYSGIAITVTESATQGSTTAYENSLTYAGNTFGEINQWMQPLAIFHRIFYQR